MGTRGVADGILGVGDTLAAPARWLLNAISAKMGGDPNLFKPMAGTVSNAVGLPTPETDAEHRAYEISRFVAPMVVGGGAAMTQGGQRAIGAAVEAGMGLAGKAAAAGTAIAQGARTAGNAAEEAAPVIMQGVRALPNAVKDGLPGISATYGTYVPQRAQEIIGKAMQATDGALVPIMPAATSKFAVLAATIRQGYERLRQLKEENK